MSAPELTEGPGYDVIGDVHGHMDALTKLLSELGYRERPEVWQHPHRTAVFVGDLIDRGPDQLGVVRTVRAMVDAGAALITMGNHEFNAIAWLTEDGEGGHFRTHSEKNRDQHERFLSEVEDGSRLHHELVDWFRSMPLWLDLGGLRVVHACWDPASMEVLGGADLTDEQVAAPKGSELYEAIEVVLKGPEIHMNGPVYVDKDGHRRDKARFRWWCPDATTLRKAAEIPGSATNEDRTPFAALPDDPIPDGLPSPPFGAPIVYGHYWRPGKTTEPHIDPGGKSACLDWSVAAGGRLAAYRWTGEDKLRTDHLVAVRATR